MLDSLNRFITKALDVASDVGKKAGNVAAETLQEAGFIGNLLTMPEEHALEELQTKMQGADERAYRMLKLTIIGMIRMAQAAEASGELSVFQSRSLPKLIQTLTIYATYVDELYGGKSSQDVTNSILQGGAQAPSTMTSFQTGEPHSTDTPAGWIHNMPSTQMFGASSPKQIISDFITKRHP
jgi:hypothetical protein